MNNVLKWMWKEASMAKFEVISQNMLGWTMPPPPPKKKKKNYKEKYLLGFIHPNPP